MMNDGLLISVPADHYFKHLYFKASRERFFRKVSTTLSYEATFTTRTWGGDSWVRHACRAGDHEALEVAMPKWSSVYLDNLLSVTHAIRQCPDVAKRDRCLWAMAKLRVISHRFDEDSLIHGDELFKAMLVTLDVKRVNKFAEQFAMSVKEAHFLIDPNALFALVVFMSDGYLRLRSQGFDKPTPPMIFAALASELPQELQMVVCNFATGRTKNNVSCAAAESAFCSLAGLYS